MAAPPPRPAATEARAEARADARADARAVRVPGIAAGDEVPPWALRYAAGDYPPYALAADVLAFAVRPGSDGDARLEALLVERGRPGPYQGMLAWPGGFVDWLGDVDAEAAARRELREETGLAHAPWLETLDTYDRVGRDPRQWAGAPGPDGTWLSRGVRVASKAFVALLDAPREVAPQHGEDAAAAHWVPVSALLPWEERRDEAGARLARALGQRLRGWAAGQPESVRPALERRIAHAFGGAQLAHWNEERAPERWALVLEAGLVEEAHRTRWGSVVELPEAVRDTGRALAFDHRTMLADALGRLRGKAKYQPGVLQALLPARFPMRDLVRAVEALGGRRLHEPNFRRIVAEAASFRIVEPVGRAGGGAAARAPRRGPAPRMHRFLADTPLRRLDPAMRVPWTDQGP